MIPVIRLHPDDGVVIARSTLLPGVEVAPGVLARERIPARSSFRSLRVSGHGRSGLNREPSWFRGNA